MYLNFQVFFFIFNCKHDVTWPGARGSALKIDPWKMSRSFSRKLSNSWPVQNNESKTCISELLDKLLVEEFKIQQLWLQQYQMLYWQPGSYFFTAGSTSCRGAIHDEFYYLTCFQQKVLTTLPLLHQHASHNKSTNYANDNSSGRWRCSGKDQIYYF